MGKGIVKPKNNSITALRNSGIKYVVVPVELSTDEMQNARIGGELPLINTGTFRVGDYVDFAIVYDATNQLMIADKLQTVPNVKSAVYDRQNINTEITVNQNEVVLLTESTVTDKITMNGGVVVIESSTVQKVKDGNLSSSVSIILFSSTVNESIKIDNATNVIFVASDSAFNDNISISKSDPSVLCVHNCRIKKLSVK